MLRRTSLALIFVLTLSLAPFASAAIIVNTTTSFSSSASQPDLYDLTDEGEFNAYFYSPFSVGDLAWQDGRLLVGHESTGTIARLDDRGGLVELLYTPLTGVEGLAAGSDGSLYASERNSNRLFKLDASGIVQDLTFMPQSITALAASADDDLIFARRASTSSSSLFDIVFWDFDEGQQSSFATDLRSVFGIAALANEILIVGSNSSSFSASPTINRYSLTGDLLGTISGPQNARSITAHTPEPGTAVLLGMGLIGLAGRRRGGAYRARRA